MRANGIAPWIAFASMSFSLVIAGCGGGGNESGPPDQVVPSATDVTVSGAPGRCYAGMGPTVFVHGGRPPYQVRNPAPLAMSLDKTEVANSGDGFTISFLPGTCLDHLTITIEDTMGRLANVQVSNVQGT